jgi:hypothetical protein
MKGLTMKILIGAAVVAGALALASPGVIDSAAAAGVSANHASQATDISARRHYRHYYRYGYRPYYRPYYYARPYYYRPYPYYAPAPFIFGFGFGPWGW